MKKKLKFNNEEKASAKKFNQLKTIRPFVYSLSLFRFSPIQTDPKKIVSKILYFLKVLTLSLSLSLYKLKIIIICFLNNLNYVYQVDFFLFAAFYSLIFSAWRTTSKIFSYNFSLVLLQFIKSYLLKVIWCNRKMSVKEEKKIFFMYNNIDNTSVIQKFCNIMSLNLAAPDAFVEIIRVTNHSKLWNAKLAWYSPRATFIFYTPNFFGCFCSDLAQFKLVKHKLRLNYIYVQQGGFEIKHRVMQCIMCMRTNYYNTSNHSG